MVRRRGELIRALEIRRRGRAIDRNAPGDRVGQERRLAEDRLVARGGPRAHPRPHDLQREREHAERGRDPPIGRRERPHRFVPEHPRAVPEARRSSTAPRRSLRRALSHESRAPPETAARPGSVSWHGLDTMTQPAPRARNYPFFRSSARRPLITTQALGAPISISMSIEVGITEIPHRALMKYGSEPPTKTSAIPTPV